MSKEDVSKVLGRAMVDSEFLTALNRNPAAAAKSIGAKLTSSEVTALKAVQIHDFFSASAALRAKLNKAMFFDNQQQQQQAQMD